MAHDYEIDNLDKQILSILINDARTPFIEIARKLIVSGGTIHQRVERMKKSGLITGSHLSINLKKLGLDVTAYLGIHLNNSKSLPRVIEQLKLLPEVVEANYTTGNFALLIKVHVKNISDFHYFLSQRLQAIEAIQSTESFISLDQPINRSAQV